MSEIKHNLKWVDLLRVFACFFVVLAHACDPFVAGSDPDAFLAGAVYGTLCRVSVPLFMMISGVLLMPTPMRLKEFYSRRLSRVLSPFIFWGVVTPFLFYLLVGGCIGCCTDDCARGSYVDGDIEELLYVAL